MWPYKVVFGVRGLSFRGSVTLEAIRQSGGAPLHLVSHLSSSSHFVPFLSANSRKHHSTSFPPQKM